VSIASDAPTTARVPAAICASWPDRTPSADRTSRSMSAPFHTEHVSANRSSTSSGCARKRSTRSTIPAARRSASQALRAATAGASS
jgi:hypothetical protein